jgi:hypothetical protein
LLQEYCGERHTQAERDGGNYAVRFHGQSLFFTQPDWPFLMKLFYAFYRNLTRQKEQTPLPGRKNLCQTGLFC